MFFIKIINDRNRDLLKNFIENLWGSDVVVSNCVKYQISLLEGFVAYIGDEIVGLLTYRVADNALEVISIDSFQENNGIGSSLLELAIHKAKNLSLQKVWLMTTNDNLPAIQFYANRDFRKKQVHLYSVRKARQKYPEIPEKGYQDIPIMHELEFEYALS